MQGILPLEVGVDAACDGEQRTRQAVRRDGIGGPVATGRDEGVRLERGRCGDRNSAYTRRACHSERRVAHSTAHIYTERLYARRLAPPGKVHGKETKKEKRRDKEIENIYKVYNYS